MPSSRKYTAETLEKKIIEYIDKCKEADTDPLIEELQGYLSISPNTWEDYANPKDKNGNIINSAYIDNYNIKYNSPEYKCVIDKINTSEVIKKYSRIILGGLFRAALKDPKKSAVVIYLSKQKAYGGYTDKQVVENTGNVDIKVTLQDAGGEKFSR